MTAPNKYVVTVNFLGTLTRGDVVTQAELPSPAKDLLAEGSIRAATDKETKSDERYVNEPQAPAKPSATAPPAPAAPKPARKRASRSKAKKAATPAATVTAPAEPAATSTDDTQITDAPGSAPA